MFTSRELATVLTALRHWQQTSARHALADQISAWPEFAEQLPQDALEAVDDMVQLNGLGGQRLPPAAT